MRTLKLAPEGRLSREKVHRALVAVHVLDRGNEWEVRTLGEHGASKRFDTKLSALEYASGLRPATDIVVHYSKPKRVRLATLTTADGGRPRIRETALR